MTCRAAAILAALLALTACGHIETAHQMDTGHDSGFNLVTSEPAPPQCANCGIEANPPPAKTYDPAATY